MNIQNTPQKIESFKKSFSGAFITNELKNFENIGIYYYPFSSTPLPIEGCPTQLHSYFYVINNHVYISDFEYEPVYSYLTNHNNLQRLKNKGILDYNNFENKKSIDKGIYIKNTYDNAGHSFCNILKSIYDIYNNNVNIDDYNIIIPECLYKYNKFLISIINLFFDEKKIIILKERMLIKCNNLYVSKDKSYKHPDILNFFKEKLKKYKKKIDSDEYKNIFLIKSNITQNCSNRTFDNRYNNYLISKGFKHIIPENYSVIELFNIINSAKNVIMSWGCCLYLNSVFINETANLLVIAHNGYILEYGKLGIQKNEITRINEMCPWTKCKKKLFIGNLESNLNDNTVLLLNSKILELTR